MPMAEALKTFRFKKAEIKGWHLMTFQSPGFHEVIPSSKGILYFLRERQRLQGVGWR